MGGFAAEGPWIQPEAPFFSSLSWIELTVEVLCDPVRKANTDHHHETQPQGTEQELSVYMRVREM